MSLDNTAHFLVDLMNGSRDRDELAQQLIATLEKHKVKMRDKEENQLEDESALRAIRIFMDQTILLLKAHRIIKH